jgi:hypothetical protein
MKHENYGYPAEKKHLRRVSSAKRPNHCISVGSKGGNPNEKRTKFSQIQATEKQNHPKSEYMLFGGAQLNFKNPNDKNSFFIERKIMPPEMHYKKPNNIWKIVSGIGIGAAIGTAALLSLGCTSKDTVEREKYREEYWIEANSIADEAKKYAEIVKNELGNIEKEMDYLTTEAYKNMIVSRIEQDPMNWEKLSMPKGAYWKDNRRILDIGEVQITKDKPILRIEQDAGSGTDLIGVKTGAGTFFGRPGKYIPFQLSSEEFENLRYDGYVHVEVGSYSVENSLLVRNGCYDLFLNRQVLYSDEAF